MAGAAPAATVGASETPQVDAFFKRLGTPRGFYGTLTVLTVVLWSAYYGRWPALPSFAIPVGYVGGDPVAVLAAGRVFSDFPPPWSLTVDRLNAPFGADWNDYPHQEKLLFYLTGLFHKLFAPGTAGNVSLLLAHVSAALGFGWAARKLKASTPAALVGALLFALSPFMLGRSLGHLLIAYVWHVPLVIYFALSLGSLGADATRRTRIATALLMAAASLQNPYYAVLVLGIVALAAARSWLVGDRAGARLGGLALGVGIGTSLLTQLNVFIHQLTDGTNAATSGRNLDELMRWGLRLPDLFLPAIHPIGAWAGFARTHYFEAGNALTENYFAFLGVVGCALALGCVTLALIRGLQGRFVEVPTEAWFILLVVLFATAGGLNYLLASFGFSWLRATNRFSIVILCLALLWGCRAVGLVRKPGRRAVLIGGSALAALLEMFGIRPEDSPQRFEFLSRVTEADENFGRELERKLPRGGAVFQLPVMAYPESPSINKMPDYAHFRPFLWTRRLRFSYGTDKGREREGWQQHAARLPTKEMIEYLAAHGFDAIMINRYGYADNARVLEASLQAAGLTLTAQSDFQDLVAYKLKRRSNELPLHYKSLALDQGFQGWEADAQGRWSWSNGSAALALFAPPRDRKTYEISFILESLLPRNVDVLVQGKNMASVKLGPGHFETVKFRWRPTTVQTTIELTTDVPGQRPSNGDPRVLAFRVIAPEVVEVGEHGRPR